MGNDQGGPSACPGCGEEVEPGWVKCPMCNISLVQGGQPGASGPSSGHRPKVSDPQPMPQQGPPPTPPTQMQPMVAQDPKRTAKTTMQITDRLSEMDKMLKSDLGSSAEVHRISEEAVARSKAESDSMLKEKDNRIIELEDQLKDRDNRLSNLEDTLSKARTENDMLKKDIEEKAALLSKDASVDEVLKQREEQLNQREDDLKKQDEDLAERTRELEIQQAEMDKAEDARKKLELEVAEKLRIHSEEIKGKESQIESQLANLELERNKVKAQAQSMTSIETKISEQKKKLDEVEASLERREKEMETRKTELDNMIEQYGDKLTAIKGREDAVAAEENRIKGLVEDMNGERLGLEKVKTDLENEKAEIKERSNKLFERLQKAEERGNQLDEREKRISTEERKLGRWEEDLRHIEIHLLSIQEETADCVYCSAKDKFMMVDKLLADAKAFGADVENAEEEVRVAKNLLDEGEFDMAIEKATKAIKMAKEAKRQYYSHGVKYTIKAVEKIISSIKELGVSTEEPDTLLRDAREALDEKDYERAEDYAKMAERIALHMEEKAEDISQGVRRLEKRIESESAQGKDVTVALGLMEEAKEYARKGNYGLAIEMLQKAQNSFDLVPEPLPEEPPVETYEPKPGTGTYEQEQEPVMQQDYSGQVEPSYQDTGGQVYQEQQEPMYQEQTQAPPPVQPPADPTSRFRCPYCGQIFEVRAQIRPVTATCPYCTQKVMIN